MGRNDEIMNDKPYNLDMIKLAVYEYKVKGKSCNSLAKKYSVPEPTLRRYILRRAGVIKYKLYNNYLGTLRNIQICSHNINYIKN